VDKGRPASRKSYHEIAFDKLQGATEQLAAMLAQNANPSRDTQENISAMVAKMRKNVGGYCGNTAETQGVLHAFNGGRRRVGVANQ
jgi:hypothetical protein